MDSLEIIKTQFKEDKYAQSLGIVLDEIHPETVKMHMQLTENHLNLFSRPHGGAIYGLADAAFSVLGNNLNVISVAVDCDISYLNSPDLREDLVVEGKILHQSRKIGTYFFDLYTIRDGMRFPIATMKSTLYRTSRPIKD